MSNEPATTSAQGNRVMIGILGVCLGATIAAIIGAGISGSWALLVFAFVVMGVAVTVILMALGNLIGSEHDTYGEG